MFYSCPFVSLCGSIIPPFVPFVLFVVLNGPFVSLRVHSWFYYSPFRAFRAFRGSTLLNGRVAELPRGRAHARHPRTTFFSLLPFPYLSEAHCKVPTHYLLLSTLYYPSFRIAQLNRRARRAQARQPRTTFFSLLSPPYFPYVYNTSCFGCWHGQPLWWHQADGSHWS